MLSSHHITRLNMTCVAARKSDHQRSSEEVSIGLHHDVRQQQTQVVSRAQVKRLRETCQRCGHDTTWGRVVVLLAPAVPVPVSDSGSHALFPLLLRPERDQERPLVLSIPHAGTVIPDDELPNYAIDTAQLLRDGDLYTDELYAGATTFGATIISSPYSRFVVDLNRLPGDISPGAVAGATARREPGYYGERGVIWAVTTHAERIYSSPLAREVYQRRLDRYYHPYHNLLAQELKRLRATFGYVVLLDCHSMPSRATQLHSDPGSARADIVPGDLLGESCHPLVSEAVASFWREGGYDVRMNHPYRGGGITRRHGAPANGVHAIQVELNRALYMDESTYARNDGFDALARDCVGLAETLAQLTLPSP